ncbi:MAG TPA: LytR C-terminal domain-containing protein [Pseudonocardiaceae bacterium]|jgi:hypothetical protein|nr:LytR C-terminal domain-containing protein [Pseudonocardiaceae bacterium]
MSPTPAPLAPARLAGFVLIGLAVIAVGLGVFALVSGGSTGSASPPPKPVSATSAPASHTTTTAPTTTTTATTVPPATSSSPAAPTPATTIVPPPATAPANAAAPVPVQVYNNGTMKGLADRAAAEFRAAGFDVVEVGNYAQTVLPHTTAYYTSPAEQQVADQLAQRYGMRTAPRFPLIGTYPPGVIVILTNDFN